MLFHQDSSNNFNTHFIFLGILLDFELRNDSMLQHFHILEGGSHG